MNEASEFRDLLPALPEVLLAVGAMVLLMLGAYRGERSAGAMNWLAILLLIGAGAVVVWLPAGKLVAFGGSFIVDPFARFLKLLALTGSATAILMSTSYLKLERQERFEYPILIVLSATGMLVKYDWPRSPCSAAVIQFQYCTSSGSSRPAATVSS